MPRFFGLATFAMLAGCVGLDSSPVSYSYRPNTTIAKKQEDLLNCMVEATRMVPQLTQIASTPTFSTPINIAPIYTTCTGDSCMTSGGNVTGGQVLGGQTYSYDANSSLRARYVSVCLSKKGYTETMVRFCNAAEIPSGISASTADKVLPISGNMCLVKIDQNIAVPIAVAK